LGTPFISGKDSLNNEFSYVDADRTRQTIAIPSTLLISALGQIDDVSRAVTMDLKQPGNVLYLVGATRNELGGSHYSLVHNLTGGQVPRVDPVQAKQTFAMIHRAIHSGLVRACHDLSEGGLAVAAAEMAFAGGLGAKLKLDRVPISSDVKDDRTLLFSESNTRFLCEVPRDKAKEFESLGGDNVPLNAIGEVVATNRLQITGLHGASVIDLSLAELKESWQAPLRW
ncbi:MAG: phosphoribosylformylglycinamidine synthase, partial [Planctomycetia bacterium]|nr:phosphoribosylformylglycinamidine synthase [Planctomycetia bacterium]